jgi:hypothetical protein
MQIVDNEVGAGSLAETTPAVGRNGNISDPLALARRTALAASPKRRRFDRQRLAFLD